MRQFILLFSFLLFNKLLGAQTITQSVESSGGDYHKQINGSVQLTIGEVFTTTNVNDSARQYGGFQQGSYLIGELPLEPVVLGIPKTDSSFNLNVTIYPNPSSGIFNLLVNSNSNDSLTIELYSTLGQVMLKQTAFTNTPNAFNISSYSGSVFYLTIIYTKTNTKKHTK